MTDQTETTATCSTCRHWTPPSGRSGYGDVLTISPAPHHPMNAALFAQAREAQDAADRLFGYCKAIALTELTLGDPIPLAVACDGSNYRADLYTQAEFGCAMWEGNP